ncbi:helix-turn-helix domain-containing protein [Cytophaga aurantiaca]|uniref:helix-turn-helix domain-containing protein n=1 Tax=Cytophaga aurantiaca TaxID=29530 RepID=UPI00047769CC|nr:AraC family transcriptional regulator [Cytophaga aurantiaca]
MNFDNNVLHIKNMVCPRCISVVEDILHELNFSFEKVKLGEVILNNFFSNNQVYTLKEKLKSHGFELLEDKKGKIVEALKTHIIQLVKNPNFNHSTKLSSFLSKEIGYDYSYISSLFTANERVTIEKYVILQKIEYVKELLSYDELTLSEIADKLNYSSLAALSTQFKSITGTTPSHFKLLTFHGRKSLDNLIP